MKVNFREGQNVQARPKLLILIDPRQYQAPVGTGRKPQQIFVIRHNCADAQTEILIDILSSDSIGQHFTTAGGHRSARTPPDQLEGTVRNDQGIIDNAKLQII